MTVNEAKKDIEDALCNNCLPSSEAIEMAIASLEAWEKVKAEIEDYMERKWEQLSDSDKVIVTGVTTIDDWKFHMAESTLDIIDRHLQEVTDV